MSFASLMCHGFAVFDGAVPLELTADIGYTVRYGLLPLHHGNACEKKSDLR